MTQSMQSLNKSFSDLHIMVIGDIMLDRYYEGETNRISPEAPVPVVKITQMQQRAGGAGNVALNITALTAEASIHAIVGDDSEQASLTHLLENEKVHCFFIKSNAPTITKLRIMAQHQQLLRLDFEESLHSLPKQKFNHQISQALNHKDYHAIILSDYGKGTLSDPQSIIQMAKKHKIPSLIDPKGTDFSRYKGADFITPNMKEFQAVVGICATESDIKTKALALIQTLNLQGILLTRSEQGMSLILHTGDIQHIPTRAKEVFDVTGAGDTVIATFTIALAAGLKPLDAMQYANTAAGIVVSKIGTATCSLSELHAARIKDIPPKKGIMNTETLRPILQQLQQQGEKIVMTNGCFDLVHTGHLQYLKAAKSQGDRLIVAINTDESVTRLKGKTRPILPLKQRMAFLNELECVDWIIPFSEDTPETLIKQLLPNILVKGADYKPHEVAGAATVIKHGGTVKTIILTPDCSSSNIIQNVLSRHSGSQ